MRQFVSGRKLDSLDLFGIADSGADLAQATRLLIFAVGDSIFIKNAGEI